MGSAGINCFGLTPLTHARKVFTINWKNSAAKCRRIIIIQFPAQNCKTDAPQRASELNGGESSTVLAEAKTNTPTQYWGGHRTPRSIPHRNIAGSPKIQRSKARVGERRSLGCPFTFKSRFGSANIFFETSYVRKNGFGKCTTPLAKNLPDWWRMNLEVIFFNGKIPMETRPVSCDHVKPTIMLVSA